MAGEISIVCTTGDIVKHDKLRYTLYLGTLLRTEHNMFMVTEGSDLIVHYKYDKYKIDSANLIATDDCSILLLFDNAGGTFKVGNDLVVCESDDVRILSGDAFKSVIIENHALGDYEALKPVKLPIGEQAVLDYFRRNSN